MGLVSFINPILRFSCKMEKSSYKCTSTGASVTNDHGSAVFNCPGCGKQQIVRSYNARQTSVKYTCPGCGFIGPN